MNKYWKILKRYRLSLFISPFLVLILVVCETVQPLFMAKIVDNGVMLKDLSVIKELGISMLLVSILGLAASICNIYFSAKTSVGFATDLRNVLFKKIQQLSFSDIDKFNSSSLITRLTGDISQLQQVVLRTMRILLRAPLMLFLALFFVWRINSEIALILTAIIPIMGLSVFFILRTGFPLFMKVQQKVDTLNSVVRENLINIRVVKSFVRRDFETKKFETSSEDLKTDVIKAANVVVSMFPAMQLLMNISIIIILWIGGQKVAHGNLKVGELISFVTYLGQIGMSLMLLTFVLMDFARASASSKRILEVMDAVPSLADTAKGLTNKNKIEEGNISFCNVCFRHHSGETDVLHNINFDVSKGETIAIVGATGSAKTTMVQLIPRLYDTTAGNIMIDGIDVKDYLLEELHDKIGMVSQKNELFTGSIIENLRWGKPNATFEDIEEAARAAQAHDFIMSFSNGYETRLGRGGINVSGGQKQRICIARALLRKPKILILDDSTSAVDTDTEKKIRDNLNTLLHDTTVFIVTQRINTMQSANRVIVLDDGSINAIGTPSELLEQSKVYQEICYSQQVIN